MNSWWIAAAVMSFATCLMHVLLGGREIVQPLLAARDLARIPRLTAYYCWHMVTIVLLAMAAALGWAAAHPNLPLVVLTFALALAFMLLSLALVAAFRVRPWYLPQWSLFAAISAAIALGLV